MTTFPKVPSLTASGVTDQGFTVTWTAPPPPYPVPLHNFDIPVCLGAKLGPVVQRWVPGATRRTFTFTGLAPGTTYTVGVRAQGAGSTDSGEWQTVTVTTPPTAISQAKITAMLDFMVSQVGKPYISVNPTRFGPTAYDCSGLVYAATQAADVPLPQSLATADDETAWFADQDGAYLVPGIPELQAGDIVGCLGAVPSPVTVNGHVYQIGHIGMMADSVNLISALNTKLGVALMNVSYLQPQLAVRPQGR